MTAKIRSRVVVQKRKCSVRCINLPQDIGGTGPSYKELTLKWQQFVENNAEFYVENDKYKSRIEI